MSNRALQKIFIDGVIWGVITLLAFYLRFESATAFQWSNILAVASVAIPVKLALIFLFGHHRVSWRYTSVLDLATPLKSIMTFTVLYLMAAVFLRGTFVIPFTVPVIDAALSIVALFTVRVAARYFLRERKHIAHFRNDADRPRRILIAGAGESGTMIAKEMMRHTEMGMLPVGFLDDAANKQNQKILGIPVLGPISHMKSVSQSHDVDELVIAMPSEEGDIIRRVVDEARKAKLHHRIIPGLYDLISGKISINQLRNVEVEDLLRRKPVVLDTNKISDYIRDRVVLVTGAGGSIGSEIVRQVCRFRPSKVILVGRGENSIYHIAREFEQQYSQIPYETKITDVRDIVSLEKIFKDTRPEVIFHAAAHKHVPLMEQNPAQAVFNNVGGTRNMVNLALEYNVKYFVNVSSDKSVNPTSVMGASKRVAEYVVEKAALQAKDHQVFVSVRFGNVLGSRGSVVPVFKEQIRKGGPITITHPDMIRYFMTIPEASQLVLQAGALHINGAVFVLDMGEPVKIVDMARDLIRLSGLEPDKDIKIIFTGVRKGEKLFEELLTAEEGTDMTQHEMIMMARKKGPVPNFDSMLDGLFDAANLGDDLQIRAMIQRIVPTYVGYQPAEHA